METPESAIKISDVAAEKLKELLASQDEQDQALRVAVRGGGCSGFQYGFSLDDAVNDDDRTFAHGDVMVVVDEISLELLAGAEVDYVTEMIGSSFRITNPNAASSCGCGSSFAI